jgi:hypothetical protein
MFTGTLTRSSFLVVLKVNSLSSFFVVLKVNSLFFLGCLKGELDSFVESWKTAKLFDRWVQLSPRAVASVHCCCVCTCLCLCLSLALSLCVRLRCWFRVCGLFVALVTRCLVGCMEIISCHDFTYLFFGLITLLPAESLSIGHLTTFRTTSWVRIPTPYSHSQHHSHLTRLAAREKSSPRWHRNRRRC